MARFSTKYLSPGVADINLPGAARLFHTCLSTSLTHDAKTISASSGNKARCQPFASSASENCCAPPPKCGDPKIKKRGVEPESAHFAARLDKAGHHFSPERDEGIGTQQGKEGRSQGARLSVGKSEGRLNFASGCSLTQNIDRGTGVCVADKTKIINRPLFLLIKTD